jgi:alpha-beta hydrolase superfamily lysophospholipase
VSFFGEKRVAKWALNDYVEDAKLALDFMLGQNGASTAHMVGHSLGGIIGLVILTDPEYAPKVRSLVTIASAVEYEDR